MKEGFNELSVDSSSCLGTTHGVIRGKSAEMDCLKA